MASATIKLPTFVHLFDYEGAGEYDNMIGELKEDIDKYQMEMAPLGITVDQQKLVSESIINWFDHAFELHDHACSRGVGLSVNSDGFTDYEAAYRICGLEFTVKISFL